LLAWFFSNKTLYRGHHEIDCAVGGNCRAVAGWRGDCVTGAELAKSKNCMNCHDLEKKKVGPSFKDVDASYQDNKDAEATIVGKLKEGKGHPVKVVASDAGLKAMIAYAPCWKISVL
jgi:cytochrome c551/c552